MERKKSRIKKRNSRKGIITPEAKARRAHTKEIRNIFIQGGFTRVTGIVDGRTIKFNEADCELDDIFIYENIIIIGEYTTINEVSTHLKKKKVIFDEILNNKSMFIKFLSDTYPDFKEKTIGKYHVDQFKIKLLYASKKKIETSTKSLIKDICYLDYPIVKYFTYIVDAIKVSARYEILSFLGLKSEEVKGRPDIGGTNKYNGSILPEAHSNFDKGFKVLSFYVDPAALLQRAYVLRKDSWENNRTLYQRMIGKSKIQSIREHLRDKKRVFINNIIVTLPWNTRILNDQEDTINFSALTETLPVKISLPNDFHTIGIIDGQHRIYSYHEGGTKDNEIKELRNRQNLLVTGIVYPRDLSDIDKTKFEANLFLEINSTQTNAKSDIKQEIGVLLKPFSPTSIGKQVLNRINDEGPLFDQFERYFYDKNKIKTTSIISYGLMPIVKLGGKDSFYYIWDDPEKEKLLDENDTEILNRYIDFSAKEINKFLIAVKKSLPHDKWTPDKKIKGRLLTTTLINGFIICLRILIENRSLGSIEFYEERLKRLSDFDFSKYHSSHYGKMGQSLYEDFFLK